MASGFESVDAYIAAQPANARAMLIALRDAVRVAAPEAAESIRYDIPSYKLHGKPLLSFGAWKRHVGIYPVAALDEVLEREVAPLRAAKSTVQLRLDKPFPGELVQRVLDAVVDRTVRLSEASQ